MARIDLNHSIAERKSYFPEIDGLRGIAILLVLAIHAKQYAGGDPHVRFSWSLLDLLFNNTARGVQLFFMVSAFTLFNSSLARYRVDAHPAAFFYIRRAFRILPFWWLMVLVVGITGGADLRHILPSILFYFGFLRHSPEYSIIPQGWSLFVEETFYVLLPVIFVYVTSLRRSVAFLALCLLVFLGWREYAAPLGVPQTGNFIFYFPLNHWYCFAIGIMIFHLRREFPGLFDRLKGGRIHLLDAALVLSIAAPALFQRKGDAQYAVAILSLAVLFIVGFEKRTLTRLLLCNPLLRRFGSCCYSIYLFHVSLFIVLAPFVHKIIESLGLSQAPSDIRFLVYFPLVSFISLAIGIVMFEFIEKPSVNLGKRLIRRLEAGKRRFDGSR